MLVDSYEGRLKGARVQRERRLKEISRLQKEGAKIVNSLSKRDLLLFGAGLYWGDGSKQEEARITNSNSELIKFMINWFERVWNIPRGGFTLRVLINKIHKQRVSQVEKYWSKVTGIPMNQFKKTVLIKAKNKKVYKNFEDHYGTLIVGIRKSTDLRHKITGLISGVIKENQKLDKKKPV